MAKKSGIITTQLEEWIMDVILDNSDISNHVFLIPEKIKNLLHAKLARKVLLPELIKAKKSLRGVSGDNMEEIYNQLQLHDISHKYISSKKWHIKARGIQELAIMNQHVDHETIMALTHAQDDMVCMEARNAMVRLHGYTGLQFFDKLKSPLSGWQQLNLLHLLAHQPITGNNGMLRWLHSSNPSVVEFSLKLISEQHAGEFHDEVVNCLWHPLMAVRREAILCLGQIPSFAAAAALCRFYDIERDKELRVSIINELSKIGYEEDLPFLEKLQQSKDPDIQLAANRTVWCLTQKFAGQQALATAG